MQVMYLGRAPRTKETLPDCLKWRHVTRHPLVFRGLTSSQRTPGFGASQCHRATSTHFSGGLIWLVFPPISLLLSSTGSTTDDITEGKAVRVLPS